MDRIKLNRQLSKFETYLVVDRGLSKNTAEGYRRTVSIALRRMKRFIPKYVDIKKYIAWMHKQNYSFNHLVNTSMGLEHYTKFKGNVVKFNRPRKPKRLLKDVLSESEVSRLILAAHGIRVKALVTLLACSGLRNHEICNLKVVDLDLGSNQVTVCNGKNRQDGIVNISPECTKVLIHYLREFKRPTGEFLFTTLVRNNQLKTADVRKIVKALAREAEIERRVFPHLLRHSLATNLLNRGASLMMIQQQLRHRYIESTMIYVISRPYRNRSEYDFYKPAYM